MTIFTITDLSRLKALAAQCRSYPGGPLAAAVYLPLVKREPQEGSQEADGNILLSADNAALLRNATATLEALFREMETEATSASASTPASSPACSLRLLLLYEVVGDEMLAALMPINALRNAAFLAADTPLVAMVDVDLSPSWSLAGQVLADSKRASALQQQSEQNRAVWVLPAFDTHHGLPISEREALADAVVAVRPEAKLSELLPMWKPRGRIHQFARNVYKAGHTATNFEKWFRYPTEYEVPYKKGYEPWFIGARGYSWNKVINVQYMAALGYSFNVLPDAWLVHRPHEPTASCSICSNDTLKHARRASALNVDVVVNGTTFQAREIFLRATKRFYRTSERRMAEGSYELVVDAASHHCRKVLPWWRNAGARQ
ncbi:hypothetical protein PLESTF_001369800 [Pleodorina starrii]|nr:hypothetical protein PLESTM_001536100 [Pleodorina starrii]GLC73388.1 hypothetical protein PLESTF_001369800 [Pleodorina starrii]